MTYPKHEKKLTHNDLMILLKNQEKIIELSKNTKDIFQPFILGEIQR